MTETPQLKYVRADSFKNIYANSALLDVTPWDFTFTFGAILREDAVPLSHVENQISITMSPQHAKALLSVLTKKLEEYEQHVGAIVLPKPEEAAPKS
jgi:hypothetical protein